MPHGSRRTLPGGSYRVIANAGHFAFFDRAGRPIPTLDGDTNADPPGFDRLGFLKQLDEEIPAFFDEALTLAPNAANSNVLP